MSSLANITIAISSFLRQGYLRECLAFIEACLPECAVIVADDGDEAIDKTIHHWKGFRRSWIQMPFDSGLSSKRNATVRACESPLLLMFCDDFRADEECRDGVERMLEVLEQFPLIDVAAGRVDKRPYEAMLEYIPGEHIRETRAVIPHANDPSTCNGRPAWTQVDLAINYFLARTAKLRACPWPEEIRPIGGEHVAFYLDAKAKGYRTVLVHGCNVKTMTLGPEAQDPRYSAFRGRAYDLGHQAMKRRYNIKQYVGMAGDIS